MEPHIDALGSNTHFTQLWISFYAATTTIYTFGFYLLYYNELAFPSRNISRQIKWTDIDNLNLDVDTSRLISELRQWSGIMVKMTQTWRMVRNACVLLVPLSLAFFQINGVSSNVYARTSALSACMLSSAGLVASSRYLILQSGSTSRRLRRKWIEASRSPSTVESIHFWVTFTFPVSSLAWSIFFCISTICIVMWTSTRDAPSADGAREGWIEPSVISSAVFLTVLIGGQVIQIYRGMKLFSEK